jgi:hypothetical protein
MHMFSFHILCAALLPVPATYTSHWSLVHHALISLMAQIKMVPFNVTTRLLFSRLLLVCSGLLPQPVSILLIPCLTELCILYSLLFNPEDGGNTFLWNSCKFQPG